MKKLLSVTLLSVCALAVSSEVNAAQTTQSITYKNTKYTLSSGSTCANGSTAIRYMRQWWCPATTTASTTPPATAPTTPVTAPTQPVS
jgi:hypothetical protein